MVLQINSISDAEITKAVDQGLSRQQKFLPNWMLYDEAGEKIFREIRKIPEYYPMRCEQEILMNHKEDLFRYFEISGKPISLIELGSGDGSKTEILLDYFHTYGLNIRYFPIDISSSILNEVTSRLSANMPRLAVHPINESYPEALRLLEKEERKALLFLGGNIGNFTWSETGEFLARVSNFLGHGDQALIGFDLKKDPRVIERIYEDPSGVISEFNLNVLKRINRELGGRFVINQFDHYSCYDPEKGMVKTYLVSLTAQSVYVEALDKSFRFGQWETIHTEIALKFDLLDIETLLSQSGFEIIDLFFDTDHHYCDVLIKKGAAPYPT
jgi:L-histidine N-alpha-methyltransferase